MRLQHNLTCSTVLVPWPVQPMSTAVLALWSFPVVMDTKTLPVTVRTKVVMIPPIICCSGIFERGVSFTFLFRRSTSNSTHFFLTHLNHIRYLFAYRFPSSYLRPFFVTKKCFYTDLFHLQTHSFLLSLFSFLALNMNVANTGSIPKSLINHNLV
jgi:hypothetical protein